MTRHRLLAALAILASLIVVAACSIDRRSESFACKDAPDCPTGRACVAGWCVVEETADSDASPLADAPMSTFDADPSDAFVCPAECTRCEGGVCIIDCNTPNGCTGNVVCPRNLPCDVRCTGQQACQGGVDCSAASACTIACTNGNTCINLVVCGKGPCDVTCAGDQSCTKGIDCKRSCSCDVTCTGVGACTPEATCPPANGCDDGKGCTSTTCNSCQ